MRCNRFRVTKMNSKFNKASPFKNAKPGFELNPSYIYDIDLIIQAKNWKNPDTKINPSAEQKNS
jgi:hypothetical protein